jgi:hypothetical protein
VELPVFRDEAAHAEATAMLREIADWAIGDLSLDDPEIAGLFRTASNLR